MAKPATDDRADCPGAEHHVAHPYSVPHHDGAAGVARHVSRLSLPLDIAELDAVENVRPRWHHGAGPQIGDDDRAARTVPPFPMVLGCPVARSRVLQGMKWHSAPRRAPSGEESTLNECYYQRLMARRTSWRGERLYAIETVCAARNERI